MQTSVIFDISLIKFTATNDRAIEYLGRIWNSYLDLLRFLATKYRPTLKYAPDVVAPDKTPARVAVYIDDQGHGIDYSQLLCQLMTTLLTRIMYAESGTPTSSLAHQLSQLLENFGGLAVATSDLTEIDKIANQIDRHVTQYRTVYKVKIVTMIDKKPGSAPVPLHPELPFLGSDNGSATEDPSGGSNSEETGSDPIDPPLNPVDLKIDGLDQSISGHLFLLAVHRDVPSTFLVGKKKKELLLEETVRLQIMDDIRHFVGRELTLEKSSSNRFIIVAPED